MRDSCWKGERESFRKVMTFKLSHERPVWICLLESPIFHNNYFRLHLPSSIIFWGERSHQAGTPWISIPICKPVYTKTYQYLFILATLKKPTSMCILDVICTFSENYVTYSSFSLVYLMTPFKWILPAGFEICVC